MTMIFLLSHQRSGSHFLKDTLRCHNEHAESQPGAAPLYRPLPEVMLPDLDRKHPGVADWSFARFLRERVSQAPETWGDPEGMAKAVVEFLQYLEQRSHNEILLVDIKLNQLHLANGWFYTAEAPPRMLQHLAGMGKLLFLRRRNVVRAILSGMIAERNGVWHVRGEGGRSPDQSPLQVGCTHFLDRVRQLDHGLAVAESWLDKCQGDVLKITYEDLFDQAESTCNPRTFDRVARFAGLTAGVPWRTAMKKIGTYAVRDVVVNYRELQATLQPTPYAALLEDQPALRRQTAQAA